MIYSYSNLINDEKLAKIHCYRGITFLRDTFLTAENKLQGQPQYRYLRNTYIFMLESSQDLYLTKSSLTICLMLKRRNFLYGYLCFQHMIKCRPVQITA